MMKLNFIFFSIKRVFAWGLLVAMGFSCSEKEETFELLTSEQTGVDFSNNLKEEARFNIFNYLYFYNGGGVAAGDINNDGLPDLYFTSNQGSNKLYLNKGKFQFEDITEQAGVGGMTGWSTGVTMADVNNDGLLDIYVSQLGDFLHITGHNQLFINKGTNDKEVTVFEDQAKKYNLDLVGFSTQAAFFDYDMDGDLDMFMLNHSLHSNGTFANSKMREETHPLAGDKLLRNDDGKFTDVTRESGIFSSALGYGLGVGISDVNNDGFPDIYIGNDFHENDYLYMNNGDGTFSERLNQHIRHTSRFSMGNDIADINNDGNMDILSLDMLPDEPEILKSAAGEDSYEIYQFKLNFGYNHQFSRNTLQLNQGNGNFSEIGLLSGIAATDWSWAGLIADYDLDGDKDIFIANGIKRRSNDLDYINYVSNEAIQHKLGGDLTDDELALVDKMPVVKINNYMYSNNGDLTFEDVSKTWGIGQPSFSNGAAYADLDNDGDLDLITNNIDEEAFIYKNNTINGEHKKANYLKIKFKGTAKNPFGIGAKVVIPTPKGVIAQEVYTTRGYQSSVPAEMVVGLGETTKIDSVTIVWPDQRREVIKMVDANQTLTVDYNNAEAGKEKKHQRKPLLEMVADLGIDYIHQENDFMEFNREALIPHMSSTEGPCLAVGDINNDGKEDIYIGGAKRQRGELFVQDSIGFKKIYITDFSRDSLHEDVDAIIVDVDNDSHNDLIVVSGGNEYQFEQEPLEIRLYRNDGQGNLSRDSDAFKGFHLNASVVKNADFDQDGDQDLFIGGRVVPWNYGISPRSFLFENDGNGNFEDITPKEMQEMGMVKDATWSDINNDGHLDLIAIGEWMKPTIFLNEDGQLTIYENNDLKSYTGWWNSLYVTDYDQDGDFDIMAGNLGLNSKLTATIDQPLRLYIRDFDNNGRVDQLLYYYLNDKEYLFASKDELSKQLVEFKSKYTTYRSFAEAEEVFDKSRLTGAMKLEAYELRSGVFINDGNLNFTFEPFEVGAQTSPVFEIIPIDVNHDQNTEYILAGNQHEVTVQRGRYDASYGILLQKDSSGLSVVDQHLSGLNLKGQVRDAKKIMINGVEHWLFATNDGPVQGVKLK